MFARLELVLLAGLALSWAVSALLYRALRQARAEADHRRRLDPQTGVFDRTHLEYEIEALTSASRRSGACWAALVIEVDGQAERAERYGAEATEQAMRSVAGTIRQAVRGGDIIGRWSEHELLVILRDTDVTSAMKVAERIRGAVDRDTTVSVGAEIGMFYEPADVVESARSAVANARAAGGDQVVMAGSWPTA